MTMDTKKKATVLALATALAAPLEGLRQVAYYDPPGILTVCYGSTTEVVKGKKYSLDECKARLDDDMLKAIEIVEKCTSHITLTTNQYVALSDMVYNLGPKPVCDTNKSTMARHIKSGNMVAACNEIYKWDKAVVGGSLVALPGLTKRRALEQNLCLNPDVL